ncbi:hypothetical protein QFZ36_000527 [Pseudarthrobacter siccitolerans]|uniref:Uncharacterized protein n=1 Tax=Pseudarthrobacter siccitolerans TaxID=861266 RepID=A0ABU0PI41_9MICC|nr:hypothetical protein [Pseudarthrobacter siccitolerans]MDQ0672966.1 hypothetical protein [Pseudarthrobacter siccitolerans]
MSTTVSKPVSDFEQVPEGTFVARCYGLVFLGTQEVQFKGESKQQEKVVIQWELLDDEGKTKDGKPFTISKTYTRTLDERGNLYSDLNAWRGKRFTADELVEFDMVAVLGAYAMLQVLHSENEKTGKTYANVSALMPYKGAKPDPVNENILFDIEEPDANTFNRLSDFLKLKVQAAPEFEAFEGAVLAVAKTAAPMAPKSDDVVIKDLPATDDINLDDIPF